MKKYKIFVGIAATLSLLTLLMIQHGWTAVKADNINEKAKIKAAQTYMKIPLHFIKNDGQVDGKVKFYEKGSGHSTFFTEEGIYMTLHDNKETSNIKLSLVNANKNPEIVGEDRLGGKVNYFIGNDKKKWKTDIDTYTAVRYKDIYENIDIKYYGNNSQLEYDIVVKPGTDPSAVKFLYEGIEGIKVTEEGDLEVDIKEKKIIHKKPYIYQEVDGQRKEIEGAFRIYDKNTYGFKVASYNKNHPLIIDPVLVYSTYLGGSSRDEGLGIAVDNSGNVYVSGLTISTDFPTQNPLQASNSGKKDVFVTKINAAGNALIYSTYLGGTDEEGEGEGVSVYFTLDLAVDGSGNVYVTGSTKSTDFPTQNPIQANKSWGKDVFIAKINASGNVLIYSTYLGGDNDDAGKSIAVDSSGNVYVTGYTMSTDFPTQSPLQAHNAGSSNAFITKINSSGSALVYSTYLGGNHWDYGNGIAIDNYGNVYITGGADSPDFPTLNPIQPSNDEYGYGDAFITKINSSGSALIYSTFLGGGYIDYGRGLAVDNSGNVYVTGVTCSADFPTVNPIQSVKNGYGDAFITKINSSGNALVYSTFLGGDDATSGYSIAVEGSGNAYVTGSTASSDFPTLNPIQSNKDDHSDAFVTKINSSGNALLFSTYLGGRLSDSGNDIAVDSQGNVYVIGYTNASTSFPTHDFPTQNPLQPNHAGNHDAFITKIGGFPEDPTPPPAPEPPPDPEPTPDPTVNPAPEIKANSFDGPVTLTTSDTLAITVSFTAGDNLGVNADWWVVVDTPFGWHYYLYPYGWYYAGDLAMLPPTAQGPLGDIGTFEILNITGLPPGTYVFFFAVDTAMNGQIDFDQLYYDGVVVNVAQ